MSTLLTRPGIYTASKAALHSLDSAMRFELAPLGVGVLTVVTGTVESSLLAKAPQFQLPPTSKYLPLETSLAEKAAGGPSGFSMMKPEDYAERVVGDVLRGVKGTVFRGSYATSARFMAATLPESFLVSWPFHTANCGLHS